MIIEAKSVGLPVITTNIGGQAEIIEDSVDGFKVPIKNSTLIASKISQLTSNVDLYNQMAMASFRSVSRFDYYHFKSIVCKIFSD